MNMKPAEAYDEADEALMAELNAPGTVAEEASSALETAPVLASPQKVGAGVRKNLINGIRAKIEADKEADRVARRMATQEARRARYCDRYGWTYEQYETYTTRLSKEDWNARLNRERVRLKRAKDKAENEALGVTPKKTKRTPEEKRQRNTEAQQRRRARLKAEEDAVERAQAIAAGQMVATEEELAEIELAEKESERRSGDASDSDHISDLLASLVAAELAERQEDEKAEKEAAKRVGTPCGESLNVISSYEEGLI